MQDSEDDYGIWSNQEENAVWEPPGEYAANLRSPSQARKSPRGRQGTFNSGVYFGEKLDSQAGALVLIADCGIGDIGFCLLADDERATHHRSLA
jgi:hypothetical protein